MQSGAPIKLGLTPGRGGVAVVESRQQGLTAHGAVRPETHLHHKGSAMPCHSRQCHGSSPRRDPQAGVEWLEDSSYEVAGEIMKCSSGRPGAIVAEPLQSTSPLHEPHHSDSRGFISSGRFGISKFARDGSNSTGREECSALENGFVGTMKKFLSVSIKNKVLGQKLEFS